VPTGSRGWLGVEIARAVAAGGVGTGLTTRHWSVRIGSIGAMG